MFNSESLLINGDWSINLKIKGKCMTEEIQEKDNFILFIILIAATFIGGLLIVKSSESDKFAPIKAQVAEELKLMNIRVLN